MSLIGYARVSTLDQHAEAQGDQLVAAGCIRVFTDEGVSGKLARRPKLDECLAFLRPGDTLVITKLDRLGRSVKNLIEQGLELAARGVELRVLHQGIDTTTPAGRLTFHLLAAIAEFERDLIIERTNEGLAAARARGRKGGRPPALTPAQVERVRVRAHAGETITTIAEDFRVSRPTIYAALERPPATG